METAGRPIVDLTVSEMRAQLNVPKEAIRPDNREVKHVPAYSHSDWRSMGLAQGLALAKSLGANRLQK